MTQREHALFDEGLWQPMSGLATVRLGDADRPWYIQTLPRFQQGSYLSTVGDWQPAQVPAHWQQHPGLEQYSGKVVYRHHFATPDLTAHAPAARLWLRCNGIFYYSQPYVNGSTLGTHEGYALPYERDITALVRAENTLLLEVDCPDEKNKSDKQMITGVFSHWDCIDPATNPGGVWLPIDLHITGAARMAGVRLATDSLHAQVANLRYSLDLDSTVAGDAVVRWHFTPHTFAGPTQTIEQRRTLHVGQQHPAGLLKLYEPRLWWTHDLGAPDLYHVTVELELNGTLSDRCAFLFGVRQFTFRNWIAYLNGERFFIKGNNYAPGDTRIATMTPERCAADVQLARSAHMNMLRVHAHVDHPAFYHAADAAGVLLWQDMPLQWLYRGSILPEAMRQVRAIVRTLYNHPSIATWCMHNEPLMITDTADNSLLARLLVYSSSFGYSWNRDVLDNRLKQMVAQEDPYRPAVRSSGEFQVPLVRHATDTHFYFGWYGAYGPLPQFEQIRQYAPDNIRFVTEFGAQSFPNSESSKRFMPADPAAIDYTYLAQRHGFQPDMLDKWVAWRDSTTLEELVRRTQDYQIYINRYYIDRLRYHKYRPTGGVVAFILIDPYPAVLWSVVDYWRVPKRSYHALRMAFNPQYAFTLIEPRTYRIAEPVTLPIYAVNDEHRAIEGAELAVRLCDPAGTTLASINHSLALAADCMAQEVDRLRFTPRHPGFYVLHIALTGVDFPTRQAYEIEVQEP